VAAIKSGIDFFLSNADKLSQSEDAVKIRNQLDKMRDQTMERLNHLYSIGGANIISGGDENLKPPPPTKSSNTFQPSSSNSSKQPKQQEHQAYSSNNFLELADDILSDDEFLIVDDVNNSRPSTGPQSDATSNAADETRLARRLRTGEFTEATEICRLDNGVQMFYIASDGSVSTPSYPTTLSIYAFSE
jgi:hypothetical protein